MQRCAYLSPGISWLWAAVATVYGKQFLGSLFVLNHFQTDSKQPSRIVKALEPFSFSVGQGATVVRDATRKVNFAAGDPRSDGAAIPQEPPLPQQP